MIPAHVSQIAPMIDAGVIGCDVAMVQVSPADAHGNHSLGLISDHVGAMVCKARVVIAEVNEQVPFTLGETVPASRIDCAVHISRASVEVQAATIGDADQAIAAHAAAFIGDGAVIQTGVGAVPDAILRLLGDRKDLGVHSGMLGAGLVDLVEAGVMKGQTLAERSRRLIAVAHPDFREDLSRAAHIIQQQGFDERRSGVRGAAGRHRRHHPQPARLA